MKMSPAEFRDRVKVPRLGGGIAMAVAAAMVLIEIYNIVSTCRSTSKNPGASFWDLFWSTTSIDGTTNPTLVVLVWGPVILLPLALILLVVDLLTHESRVDKAYQRYLQDGWTAQQVPTGITVTVNRSSYSVVVLAGPDQDLNLFVEAVARASARVNGLKGGERRAWNRRVASKITTGLPVGDLMPELAPTVMICSERHGVDQVIVVGKGPDMTPDIYPLKPQPQPVAA